MNKKLKIIVAAVLIIFGVVSAVLLSWGEPTSQLQKTELKNTENNNPANSLGFNDISGTTWVVQSDNNSSAELGFVIDGDLKETKGFFEKFDIVFKVAENQTDNAKIKVVIDVSSINTENSIRDKSLMDEDFFNLEKYPTISYFSKKIRKKDENYITSGVIEMMGLKSELSFAFIHKGISVNKNNIKVAIFEGEMEIDRTMFGMSHTPSVGDIVKLNFYCELVEKI